MSAKFKAIVFSVGVLILIPPAFFVGNLLHISIKMSALRKADHARILSACREAIANRGSYRNDNTQWGPVYKDDVLILGPMPGNLPQALRELQPHDVIIRDDYILINLSMPFCRLGLLGFRSGAKQYGTSKYIDGLWFWNGNDMTKNGASEARVLRSQ